MIANSHTNHKVRIDDFPVRGDGKEVWDTNDFENWLGESRNNGTSFTLF
ncbi:inositol-3-phosphate synthase [Bacillus cereus]|nr:inositol-3-phosphate synthase [Bacillus cereus]